MNKVKFESINEAVIKASNSSDENRVFNISANVRVNNKVVNSIDQGIISKEDITLCTFNKWGNNNLNTNFSINDLETMCNILTCIDSFINEISDVIATSEITINN